MGLAMEAIASQTFDATRDSSMFSSAKSFTAAAILRFERFVRILCSTRSLDRVSSNQGVSRNQFGGWKLSRVVPTNWLSRVVFPAPKKPVTMVTGRRRCSACPKIRTFSAWRKTFTLDASRSAALAITLVLLVYKKKSKNNTYLGR